MRILFIHNKYGKYSGEEAVVDAQIQLLKENGYKVITYFRSSEEIDSIQWGKLKAFLSPLYHPEVEMEILQKIQEQKPDIVHIHNLYPFIPPEVLLKIKKTGIPIVMTVHNYRLMCPNGLFFTKGKICEKCVGKWKEWNCIANNCEGSIFKSTGYALRNSWSRIKGFYKDNVDAFLCLTDFQKNKLIENGYPNKKMFVVPNFYNEHINTIDYDLNERSYVAFSGRISPEKGIHLLIEAAKQLPDIPFKVAGHVREGILKNIEIPENLEFVGMLDSRELKKFYNKARFLVLSSIWYEGFPMVFPEAMAHGLPLIAPDMAGFPEIATPKNGLLFQPGNVNTLAVTIRSLWDDPERMKKMSIESVNIVKEQFSRKRYFDHLDLIYNQLMRN